MIKHDDMDTPLNDLRALFEMINQKAGSDKFICAMRQYIVNPLAWFETEKIAKSAAKKAVSEVGEQPNNTASTPCCVCGVAVAELCGKCHTEIVSSVVN